MSPARARRLIDGSGAGASGEILKTPYSKLSSSTLISKGLASILRTSMRAHSFMEHETIMLGLLIQAACATLSFCSILLKDRLLTATVAAATHALEFGHESLLR